MIQPASAASTQSLSPNTDALISMRGIKKVFVTDEVETHALVEVHIYIKQG